MVLILFGWFWCLGCEEKKRKKKKTVVWNERNKIKKKKRRRHIHRQTMIAGSIFWRERERERERELGEGGRLEYNATRIL